MKQKIKVWKTQRN